MKKVCLVTSGSYADYCVEGVFSSRKGAEEFSKRLPGSTVETKDLDPEPPPWYFAEISLSTGEVTEPSEKDKDFLFDLSRRHGSFTTFRDKTRALSATTASQAEAESKVIEEREAYIKLTTPRPERPNRSLTISSITDALREGFTHGYVTSEIGDRQSVRFSVLTSVGEDEYLFFHDAQLDQILGFSSGVTDFTTPILERWHRYMTLPKDELEKEDGVLHVPLLGPELTETTDG